MQPEFLPMTVKAIDGDSPHGEFEAILSTETFDRQGEAVAAKALEPLPESIPVYHQHDWRTGALPVAKAVPFYDGEVLKARGVFASTERGQEIRTLVTEGIVDAMSVGFLRRKSTKVGGKPVVTKGELFEASFTGIPVNPDARVLVAKAGARHAAADLEHIQTMHDRSVALGAVCAADKSITWDVNGMTTTDVDTNVDATSSADTDTEPLPPQAPDAAAATEPVAAAADEEERERLRQRARVWQLPPT